MPLAVFLPNQILESANLHPQDTIVSPAADPENHTSLIPLFGYEEDSEVHEPNPLINAETDRCSDGEPVCHQNSMSEKVLDVNKASTNDGMSQINQLSLFSQSTSTLIKFSLPKFC